MNGSTGTKALAGSVTDPAVAVPAGLTPDDVSDASLDRGASHDRGDGHDAASVEDLDEGDVTEGRQGHSRLVWVGLAAMAVLLVLRLFVAEPVRTNGNSMAPTLHDGEALVIDTLSYHFRDPSIGEVVVARVPTTGERVVKRVVAVAGDTVGLEDGVLVRNGQPVTEPYANQAQMAGTYWGSVEVPPGQVFLMGDNRLESVDSRHYGPVSVDDVDGRYLARLWPF